LTTTLQHRGTATQAPSLNSGWTQLEFSQSAPPVLSLVMAKKEKLGIETMKGKEAVRREREALDAFCRHHHHMDYVAPPADEPAVVDAFFTVNSGKDLYAVVEVKSRSMTKKKLAGDYGWEMLITNDKVERGRMMGNMLCSPFVVILYLVPDKIMLVQQISDKYGDLTVDLEVRETISQKTVNGGEVLRDNAFINMKDAKEYKV